MKKVKLLIYLFLLLGLGCKTAKSKVYVLQPDSMKVVLFDFLLADEWNTMQSATDTTFLKLKNNLKSYQQVLAIHHITKEIFDSSLNYYEQNPAMFKILIDSVNAYGSRLKDKPLLKNHPKPE